MTTFSGQFDSRLERLRSELQLDDESVANADTTAGRVATDQDRTRPTIADRADGDQTDPFATTRELSEELPIVAGNGGDRTVRHYPSLMTEPRRPIGKTESSTALRIEALMADARQDWEAWRLDRAYQTAVAAQKLAVRENMQFAEGEDQPADLVRQIAADLHRGTVPALADGPTRALESNAFGFDELDRLANPWTAKEPAGTHSSDRADTALARTGTSSEKERVEPVVPSQSSGVSLLPPDDDFPSDANAEDWPSADPRDIRLATHKFPQFSLSGDAHVREQMKGLSAEDNQALLQNIADQKNRVLGSKGFQWPELPSAQQPRGAAEGGQGPILVAQAPRFTLEDDIAIAATPDSEGDTGTSAPTGSLLGQFWRSQPIWFIGGLVLLIVALRLWPWPKNEEA